MEKLTGNVNLKLRKQTYNWQGIPKFMFHISLAVQLTCRNYLAINIGHLENVNHPN